MKKLLTDETKRKVTDSIISILAESKCTYSDFQEISKSVTKLYSDNAVLMIEPIGIDKEQAERSIETLANTFETKIWSLLFWLFSLILFSWLGLLNTLEELILLKLEKSFEKSGDTSEDKSKFLITCD